MAVILFKGIQNIRPGFCGVLPTPKIINTGKTYKKLVDIGPTQRKIDLLQVACGLGSHSISVNNKEWFKYTTKCICCGQKLVEAKKK